MDIKDLINVEMPEVLPVGEHIARVPASMNPLSSDIGIVYGSERTYLYDVGSSLPALKFVNSVPDNKAIVISHFHGDHTWWLSDHTHGEHGVANDDNISTNYDRPRFSNLYVSKESYKHTVPKDKPTDPVTLVSERTVIDDGVHLEIVPLPCTHCKGSLVLTVDDDYAFLGDSTYPNKVNGVTYYNAQLLKTEIEILESLRQENFLLSHDDKFVRPKKVVLRQLKSVYDSWDKTDSLIRL